MLEAKKSLRAEMRAIRKALPDRAQRSSRIWRQVQLLAEVQQAATLLVFDTIPGEPHTASFIEWCQAEGKRVAAPEDDVDPSWPDVIIVPGLAFTRAGQRVGQGGGWYDRFLSKIRADSTTIGVCFEPQIVEAVPTEDHDIAINIVIAA